jgi:hypothetical protein
VSVEGRTRRPLDLGRVIDTFVFDGERRLVYPGQLDGSRSRNDLPVCQLAGNAFAGGRQLGLFARHIGGGVVGGRRGARAAAKLQRITLRHNEAWLRALEQVFSSPLARDGPRRHSMAVSSGVM